MKYITEQTIFNDKELGAIKIKPNRNSRQIKFRIAEGSVSSTVPYGTPVSQFISDIESLRNQISEKLKKCKIEYKAGIVFCSEWLNVNLVNTGNRQYVLKGENDSYTIYAPDESHDNEIIKNAIYQCMRHRAKQVLPVLIKELADKYGFTYNSLKINSSKGRWGSCSSSGNINLSISVMALPKHLTSYVILHELCHTRFMAHDDRFYNLLNICSEGKSDEFRKELKHYTTWIGPTKQQQTTP